MHKASRWLSIYPALRELVTLEVDSVHSCVLIRRTQAFIEHVHTLANEVITERGKEQQKDEHCSVNTGVTP